MKKSMPLHQGTNTFSLENKGFQKGLYVVPVSMLNKNLSKKITIAE